MALVYKVQFFCFAYRNERGQVNRQLPCIQCFEDLKHGSGVEKRDLFVPCQLLHALERGEIAH